MENKTHHRVICFGEVLWDILPSGAVPGGAPMNVTYHLHKQDKNPALITRVGIDEKGKQLIDIFSEHGVCTDYFQLDADYETGKVFAHPNERHEMVYDIVKPVAWDFIEWEKEYDRLVSQTDYFVFGSLAARSPESKKTLQRLLGAAKTKVLDINLRAPYYDRRIIEELLEQADILKLNLAELELITGWFSDYISIDERIKFVADRFNISNIVVTRGADGAVLYIEGKVYRHPGFLVEVKDTVGSGDAFLAGLLSRLMENDKPQDALLFANAMGAFVAGKTGACPHYNAKDVFELIKEGASEKKVNT
jgi:fructokinase